MAMEERQGPLLIYILSSAITAPLHTIGISLQLSVRGHKELFTFKEPPQKEGLVKRTFAITPQERRKYELMVRVRLPVGDWSGKSSLHFTSLPELFRVHSWTVQPGLEGLLQGQPMADSCHDDARLYFF
jgi:hypothetical protein